MKDEEKTIFLAALQEPLRIMLAVLHFKTNTMDQVIDRVLEMDRAQNSNYMAMGATTSAA